jgi:hypothetical protein
LVPLKEG